MIWKNFRKELLYTASRLISVVVLTAIATMMLISLRNVVYNGNQVSDAYLGSQNTADFWITGNGINKRDIFKISDIDGVESVQPRVTFEVEDKDSSEITLAVYAVPDYEMNVPYIVSGTFPQSNREIMVSDRFAEEHNLGIGDMLDTKIAGTGQRFKKEICALIKSPEALYHVNADSTIPNFHNYGFAYLNETAINDIYGKNIYNQLCLTITDNADEEYIKSEISDILGNRLITTIALEDNVAASQITGQMKTLNTLTIVFPFLFYFVAALIMYSTMSRLIENSRGTIGTLKALGYDDKIITLYYLLYSIIVVVFSFILGILPSSPFTKFILKNALFSKVDLPPHDFYIDWSAWGLAAVLGCIFCIGTAYMVLRKSLAENPAQCMRPKPPKKVKPVFFERFKFWKKLSFSTKYIIRNMFRNKGKMAICIIGVAGCTMLIMAALGAYDSINNAFDSIETRSHNYDVAVGFSSGVTEEQYKHIGNLPDVTHAEYEMITSAKIYTKDSIEAASITVTENVTHLKLPKSFAHAPVVLPEDGAWIETKLAEELGIEQGDTITVKFIGSNKYREIPIVGLSQDSSGIVMSKDVFRQTGQTYKATDCYVTTSNSEKFLDMALKYDFVSTIKTVETAVQELQAQLSFVSVVIVLIIFFAGMLAFVVLQNLGTMSFYEQIRNIATLLVLGFYDKESKKLLLTENMIFAFIGFIFGLPLGLFFCQYILAGLDMWIEINVNAISFVIAFLLTMSFAAIVNKLLAKKIKTIDMLGALKSVE